MPLISSQEIPATRWFRSLSAAGLHSDVVQGPARPWLTLEGSLTRALQLRCSREFHVEVISEGWQRPDSEEQLSLGIGQREYAWIRQVRLCGDGTPWVLARTVIPRDTLQGRNRRLKHLGNKPLGAHLFSDPAWHRGRFETGLCRTTLHDAPHTARRSRFYSGDKALLVGEYFLPRLLESGRQPFNPGPSTGYNPAHTRHSE